MCPGNMEPADLAYDPSRLAPGRRLGRPGFRPLDPPPAGKSSRPERRLGWPRLRHWIHRLPESAPCLSADSDDPDSALRNRHRPESALDLAPCRVCQILAGPITHCRSRPTRAPDSASANPAMEGRTANHSPAATQHATNNLHIQSRRAASARPKDHGSLWYPTHSTTNESLPRAPHGR